MLKMAFKHTIYYLKISLVKHMCSMNIWFIKKGELDKQILALEMNDS